MSRITPGAHHLVGELSQLGVHLKLSGDRLLCHVPSGRQLPAEIAARIRDHKQQLISHLHHISRANEVPDFAFSEHPVFGTISLSSGQARICLHEHVYPSNDFYVMSTALRKIDVPRLPPPGELGTDRLFITPRIETEDPLARIWNSILRVEKVGVHDNFFSLSGHSLLATQVMSQIRKTWQLELPLRFLFESPTVALLSMRIEQENLAHECVEI